MARRRLPISVRISRTPLKDGQYAHELRIDEKGKGIKFVKLYTNRSDAVAAGKRMVSLMETMDFDEARRIVTASGVSLSDIMIAAFNYDKDKTTFAASSQPTEAVPDTDAPLKLICKFYRVDVGRVLSKTREAEVVDARRAACYFLRNVYKMSYPKTGKTLGVDHASVKYHEKCFVTLTDSDPEFNRDAQVLRKKLLKQQKK